MALTDTSRTERSNRRYVAAAMRAPLLEREWERDLARRWHDEGDEAALHEMIESHSRLAIRIAVGFRKSGLPVADLVQEGNIGLLEAARRFDPERDVRFSTYASWWIVAAIQNYILRNSSIVRAATTPKQRRLFFNLRRLRARHGSGYNGALTTDERERIAAKLDVTVEQVENMEAHLARPDQSLNITVGQDDTVDYQDLLAADGPSPEDRAAVASNKTARRRFIRRALDRLSARERRIIADRYLGEQRLTLAEIGEQWGVSKERIRQIEARALQKMREVLSELIEQPDELFDS